MTIRKNRANAVARADQLCREYWGVTGKDRTFEAAREEIRGLGLQADEIDRILDRLPPRTSGPVGERIGECYRFLERLRG